MADRGLPGADWERAVEELAGGASGRVLLVGPVDSGKSTLARAVLDAAARRGRRAALIDTDVGQKIVGPPAAVTAARAEAPDALAALAFVGTTNPLQGFSRLVEGVRELGRRVRAELLVANTGGFIGDRGRALKAAKIGVFRPDLIVALGNSVELEQILAGHSGAFLRLTPSPYARRKTAGRRRAARSAAFRQYFRDSVPHRLPPEAMPAREQPWPERLLVGLADERGRDLALGILLQAAAQGRGATTVLAPEVDRRVARLIPGQLTLDEDFRSFPLGARRN